MFPLSLRTHESMEIQFSTDGIHQNQKWPYWQPTWNQKVILAPFRFIQNRMSTGTTQDNMPLTVMLVMMMAKVEGEIITSHGEQSPSQTVFWCKSQTCSSSQTRRRPPTLGCSGQSWTWPRCSSGSGWESSSQHTTTWFSRMLALSKSKHKGSPCRVVNFQQVNNHCPILSRVWGERKK